MSSNRAEPFATAGKKLPLRRSWSLTARLALVTALSSFAILTFVSIQMYFLLASHLEEQNYRYLRDEVESLSSISRFPEFAESLAMEMHVDPVGEGYLTHYVRLLDKDGRKVIETPNMDECLSCAVFPPPEVDGRPDKVAAVQSPNGSRFIVTTVGIAGGVSGKERDVLQVGLDVTNIDQVLAGYRNKLALALAGGFLCCAGAGLAIARRGTRSLRELTEKVGQITASGLDERLCGADWPQELNSLADALNGMLGRLQDSFGRLYDSVQNFTHKLRTPLTILRGEAEVTLARERSAEELREVIASSLEEYGRVSHLVDNIVFVAQVAAGKLQPVLADLDAGSEIEVIREFYEPVAEEKGIALACRGNASLTADSVLFRKAVANLLSNALNYTPAGGEVVISTRQGDDRSVEVSVADTGCGIAEHDMPRIFDWFYRVYATRCLDHDGSGLGLHLVKSIMDLHDGTVAVLSQPGQGTTVVLKFPPPAG